MAVDNQRKNEMRKETEMWIVKYLLSISELCVWRNNVKLFRMRRLQHEEMRVTSFSVLLPEMRYESISLCE